MSLQSKIQLNLYSFQALYLNHNGLKCLPATLLKLCTRLSTLELHGTEITMDLLRQVCSYIIVSEKPTYIFGFFFSYVILLQFEGWESFDERRCLKVQKQLDSRAGNSAAFDEGADKS